MSGTFSSFFTKADEIFSVISLQKLMKYSHHDEQRAVQTEVDFSQFDLQCRQELSEPKHTHKTRLLGMRIRV